MENASNPVEGRFLKGLNFAIKVIALAMVVYHFIGVYLSPLDPTHHANTHLLFALLLVFLPSLAKAIQKKQKGDIFFLAIVIPATLACILYVYYFSEDLQIRAGLPTETDIIIGTIILLAVYDAVRRSMGIALPLFSLAFVAYAFFGHYLPHPFHVPQIEFGRMISWLSINLTTGIYSSLLFISANIVFLFIMFGSVLEMTKAQDFFIMLGSMVGRNLRGGPAQTAVVSSGLVGSITGAAAANVVLTGSVTIPLMKKTGFKPEMAGAVEAVASSGGLLMPPVMGSAVFIMASLTGILYAKLCYIAIIPALLYYISAGVSVYLYAGKEKIPLTKIPIDYALMLRRSPMFLVPFGVLIVLLALQYSAAFAAGCALIAGLILGFFSKETRPSFIFFVDVLTRGAKTAAMVGAMLALAGTFVSVMSLTMLGPKIVNVVEGLAAGQLPLVLLFTMVVSLILGCAVPMSGGYLLVALLITPVLLRMEVTQVQAHFFALYFSVIGWLTPPMAPAALVASGLAKASFFKTALQAIRIAAAGYLIPFMFVYDSSLLGQFQSGALWAIVSITSALLVILSLGVILFSYYLVKVNRVEFLLAFATLLGAFGNFFIRGSPLSVWFFIGSVICFIVLTLSQTIKRRSGDIGTAAL